MKLEQHFSNSLHTQINKKYLAHLHFLLKKLFIAEVNRNILYFVATLLYQCSKSLKTTVDDTVTEINITYLKYQQAAVNLVMIVLRNFLINKTSLMKYTLLCSERLNRDFVLKINFANCGPGPTRHTYAQDYNPERDIELLINRRIGQPGLSGMPISKLPCAIAAHLSISNAWHDVVLTNGRTDIRCTTSERKSAKVRDTVVQ